MKHQAIVTGLLSFLFLVQHAYGMEGTGLDNEREYVVLCIDVD